MDLKSPPPKKNTLNEGTPLHIVWDISKAYFRGFVINYMAQKNKKRKQKHSKIFTDLKAFETKLQNDPFNSKRKDLIANLQYQQHYAL